MKRTLVGAGIMILGAVVVSGVFFYNRKTNKSSNLPAAAPPQSGVSLRQEPPPREPPVVYEGEPAGMLAADPVFVRQVPADAFASAKKELAELGRKLESDPREPSLWMRVAYLKHFYNDDRGARDAYEYLNTIASGDPIPYYNLALIYAYDLKEPVNAIPKFRAAISIDPASTIYRIGLADFYREVLHDLPAAEETLEAALRGVETTDVLIALASLDATTNKRDAAVMYYEKALSHRELGAGERAVIVKEIERLKGLSGR